MSAYYRPFHKLAQLPALSHRILQTRLSTMTTYDFDTQIDRSNTGSVKWQLLFGGENLDTPRIGDDCFGENRVIPMWVADMDFRSPQPVIDALAARVQHGIFGYTLATDDYKTSVCGWMRRRHNWDAKPEWIVTTPGVVPALHWLVRAFTAPGEKVIIQSPVYYPFYSATESTKRTVARNPLIRDHAGRYSMDFDALEALAAKPDVTCAILSSPHNPVGRVWTPDELQRFGDICTRNGVFVIADEIHADLILSGFTHTSYGTLEDRLVQNSAICTAPSKTFNLAGLQTSNIFIASSSLRERFQNEIHSNGMFDPNLLGMVACKAAYDHGEEWLTELLSYIEGNFATLKSFLETHLPELKLIKPEGTYLAWIDCRTLGLDKMELKRKMLCDARVFLDDGFIFGPEGDGFERINLACPRPLLIEALTRIKSAIRSMK